VVTGTAGSATVAGLDLLLRRLADEQATTGRPMPDLAAVALTGNEITMHLRGPGDLPAPWAGAADRMHWTCPCPDAAAGPGPGVGEVRPAPYPLLVTIGAGDTGAVWLLNLEVMGAVTVTGDPDRSAAFVRYLAAELACNSWSDDVRVGCVGVGHQAAAMNPYRIRVHTDTAAVCADAVADAVAMIDRTGTTHTLDTGTDVATARGAQLGDDIWPAHVVLVDASGPAPAELDQLLALVGQHPGRTATAVVLTGRDEQDTVGVQVHLTEEGRLQIPSVGLDLAVVGLTAAEGPRLRRPARQRRHPR